MYCVRTPRNLTPWHLHAFLLRHSSSHTPAPGRIYSQKQLFEEKRAAMQANHPEKYALASQFMANRADRPINFKSDDPKGRFIVPSPQEKRLLVLTGVYKRQDDIPELVHELKIATVKERLNLLGAIFCGFTLFCSFLFTMRQMRSAQSIVNQKFD